MPRLLATNEDQVINIPGPGNFQFSAVRIEDLGATEYTLVTIVCDISGSVATFSSELLNCIKAIIESCKKNPRAENTLVRLMLFNNNLKEIHGFKNLSDIDINDYKPLTPNGETALFDATYNAVCATMEYAKRLNDQDFDCNGAVYIITDGMNNRGKMTANSIAKRLNDAMIKEEIESIITTLVGLIDPKNTWSSEIERSLNEFYQVAKLTNFINVGEATPENLAKLANWVSQSISSQSQALGTGTPSQSLAF